VGNPNKPNRSANSHDYTERREHNHNQFNSERLPNCANWNDGDSVAAVCARYFACRAVRLQAMPSRRKIDLTRVRASLTTVCPNCGHEIEPAELRRIDFNRALCPPCKAIFTPGKTPAH